MKHYVFDENETEVMKTLMELANQEFVQLSDGLDEDQVQSLTDLIENFGDI